jgi:O-acetyl-ADP-ribose deacetylase (regulator of RNase III)
MAEPRSVPGDVVVLPAARAGADPGGRVVRVRGPRWNPRGAVDHLLAQAYRDAMAAASARGARSLVLPDSLSRGPWPLDDVTRIALTVLLSTPSTVREITIAAKGPGTLERWAEALAREL